VVSRLAWPSRRAAEETARESELGKAAIEHMSFGEDLDRQRAQIMRAVRRASDGWAEAMRAHKLAPPDAGFAERLRNLSEAAASEQVAWEHAHAAGLLWRPVPGAENASPPYELRPGTGRRGPAVLWERFDAAVGALNLAITGSNAAEVADAFGEFAEAADALATAVAQEDETARASATRASRQRTRGAA
jgi:hypothetical protein